MCFFYTHPVPVGYKYSMIRYLISFIVVLATSAYAGDLLITEFVAENRSGILDEDNRLYDWIEIYNQGATTIDLAGWSLTDSETNLVKWVFPTRMLDADDYLIIFASGKDRTGAELHTNFSLDNDGDYLAIVMPDGTTISHDYTGGFPQQYPDLSFGLDRTISTTNLLASGDAGRYLIPVDNSLGNTWKSDGFDDSGWAAGASGFGYDASGNFSSLISTDLQGVMSNVNASVYIRLPFNVPGSGRL